ncbi:putative ABC transport system permease protein [Robiginitalea myxolifaciens]|uniref:Putative ABC transport system permease protein n=1 Tax=Robiginitalea myxolifaciens TaxID=400055 RepID=A0A1I6HAF2_9FLAO|nr:FtsX-like permease family protein [Robiginitalea myxolifaciens]SFR51485.1 putative ABC transport system permease protein [Robiginitalea myxolifaciens]
MSTQPFNVDKAISDWQKALLKYHSIDPEFAEELASGLRDRYDALLKDGIAAEDAFARARKKTIADPNQLAREMSDVKSRSTGFLGDLAFLLPNYLKIGWRNLGRKSFYNLINLTSLTIGIVCAVLAILYIDYETSFDDFVPESERIYRVGQNLRSQEYSMIGFEDYNSSTAEKQQIHIDAIRKATGVEAACQFFIFDNPQYINTGEDRLETTKILQTNTPNSFLELFGWEWIVGSKEQFTNDPRTVLFTESEAERFYGMDWNADKVIGQSIVIDTTAFTIAGVLKDVPSNSHLDFNVVIHQRRIDYWGARTYVKAANGTDGTAIKRNLDLKIGEINPRLSRSELFGGFTLDRLQDIHLNSDKLYEIKPPGDKQYLYIFSIISSIILLLTISNYTNLSIAMNASRMREIGMRKIFGASQVSVSKQFLIEALLIALLSTPLIIVLLIFIIPRLNAFMGVAIATDFWAQGSFWLLLISLLILVGLLSGLYPSIFLSNRKITSLFKGNMVKDRSSSFTVRKAIITFQFGLLIGLCSLTLFVNNQLEFISDKDLGYQKENILYVDINSNWETFTAFRNELNSISGITGVGTGSDMGTTPYNQTTYRLKDTDQVFDDAYNVYFDYASLKLLGIETSILDYLDNPLNAPSNIVLINETAAQKLSTQFNIPKEDLIGRTIIEEPEYTDEETGEVGFPFQIGGFTSDINVFSLKEKITPMFVRVYRQSDYAYLASISYDESISETVLQSVEAAFKKVKPNDTFMYEFLTQNVNALYEQEQKIGRLCVYFSVIAFLVAILGLIALTAYLTTLKRKEIGMRKILGASTLGIVKLFNKEYLPLLVFAFFVAAPVTYLGVSRWLSTFAYRIDINLMVFLLATVLTLAISSAAVSLVTLRVIRSEPVEALREEQ